MKMELHGYEEESHSESSDDDDSANEGQGYRLIDLKSLSSSVSDVHKCDDGNLSLKENAGGKAGLVADLYLECSSCGQSTSLKTSTTVTKRGKSYDANRRAVYHSIETGGGYEGLSSFCSIMNMPSLSKSAYYKQVDNVLGALEVEAKEDMKRAGARLRQIVFEENEGVNNDNDIVDVAVSFDGTWAKRGFTSLTGIVFAISVDTGEIKTSTTIIISASTTGTTIISSSTSTSIISSTTSTTIIIISASTTSTTITIIIISSYTCTTSTTIIITKTITMYIH
ncbi:hypothetical protein QZH41_003985 [Actinostola sp. cb2023]|nr:hypothetical protein QZH41_003985 [Actinostola sp. cb2023]